MSLKPFGCPEQRNLLMHADLAQHCCCTPLIDQSMQYNPAGTHSYGGHYINVSARRGTGSCWVTAHTRKFMCCMVHIFVDIFATSWVVHCCDFLHHAAHKISYISTCFPHAVLAPSHQLPSPPTTCPDPPAPAPAPQITYQVLPANMSLLQQARFYARLGAALTDAGIAAYR
jgi:hypothetical protein